MKNLITPIYLILFFVFSGMVTAQTPLEMTRQKLTEAKSIEFSLDVVMEDPAFNRSMEMPRSKLLFVANNEEIYPHDFLYVENIGVSFYKNGELFNLIPTEKIIITFDEENTRRFLIEEPELLVPTQYNPTRILAGEDWMRSRTEGPLVVYEKVVLDRHIPEGHQRLVSRIFIDSTKAVLQKGVSENFLNDEKTQIVSYELLDIKYDATEEVVYNLPPALPRISMSDFFESQKHRAIQPGDEFPEFELVDVNGKTVSTQGLKGKKVVIAFSFIGCGGCEFARKELTTSGFQFNEEYVGIYLNPYDSSDELLSYQTKKPWPFQMVAGGKDIAEKCGVFSYPKFITLDEDGKVEEVIGGYQKEYFTNKGK